MSQIVNNFKGIIERLNSAAEDAGRDPDKIRLIAVTKGVDIAGIKESIEAGVEIVGENRVQEALPKIETIKDNISWHMIGHLQTNKVKEVIGRFALIHSVDSVNLAREIDRRAKARGIVQKILLEANLSREESKYGFCEEDIIDGIREISELENITVKGLMTIPPYSADPEEARKYFSQLSSLFNKVKEEKIDNIYMEELSMGMSNDFEVAIEEGATMVRVGTAIFGQRYYG